MVSGRFACPYCLREGLEVKVHKDVHCLAWECSDCGIMGVVGTTPKQAKRRQLPAHEAEPVLTEAERAVLTAIRNGASDGPAIRAAARLTIMSWLSSKPLLQEYGLIRTTGQGDDLRFELTTEGRRLVNEELTKPPEDRGT